MKLWKSILLFLTVSLSAFAQDAVVPSVPPDVEVVSSYVGTRNASQLVENQRSITPQGVQYTGSYNADLGVDPRYVRGVTELSRRPVSTKYALLRVKNIGTKTIKAIEWEAPHMNFKDGQLLVRLPIKSKVDLKAGEMAHLKQTLQEPKKRMQMTAMTGSGGTYTFPQTSSFLFMQFQGAGEAVPPIQTLTFTTDKGESYTIPANWRSQPILLKRIEYADGSVWQRP